jgi:hypothetical protein
MSASFSASFSQQLSNPEDKVKYDFLIWPFLNKYLIETWIEKPFMVFEVISAKSNKTLAVKLKMYLSDLCPLQLI